MPHCLSVATLFHQPNQCPARSTAALTSRYGDILYKINDLEASIAAELIKRLMRFAPALNRAAAAVAELDCLAAFALVSRRATLLRTCNHIVATSVACVPCIRAGSWQHPFHSTRCSYAWTHAVLHVSLILDPIGLKNLVTNGITTQGDALRAAGAGHRRCADHKRGPAPAGGDAGSGGLHTQRHRHASWQRPRTGEAVCWAAACSRQASIVDYWVS